MEIQRKVLIKQPLNLLENPWFFEMEHLANTSISTDRERHNLTLS